MEVVLSCGFSSVPLYSLIHSPTPYCPRPCRLWYNKFNLLDYFFHECNFGSSIWLVWFLFVCFCFTGKYFPLTLNIKVANVSKPLVSAELFLNAALYYRVFMCVFLSSVVELSLESWEYPQRPLESFIGHTDKTPKNHVAEPWKQFNAKRWD